MAVLDDTFSALNSDTRRNLLELIRDKRLRCSDPETCDLSQRCCNVSELARELGLTQPTVSHHLKELRRAGLITVEKDGRTKYCTLNDSAFKELSQYFRSFFKNGDDDSCQ